MGSLVLTSPETTGTGFGRGYSLRQRQARKIKPSAKRVQTIPRPMAKRCAFVLEDGEEGCIGAEPGDDVEGVEGELEEVEEELDSTGTKEGDGEVAGDGSPAFNDVYLFRTH